jgi:hypothetical protein
MAGDPIPGTLYWIDHYVVASTDLDRWSEFQEKVIGATSLPGRPGARRFIAFQDITPCCHHGAMISDEPLPPSAGLGKAVPRHALFIRPEDIDQHRRRLELYNVPHLDPGRTSAEGDDGISLLWEDPDGNQFEFWAPDRMPEGAMANCTSVGVGRISHVILECQDLQRAADLFASYGGIEPRPSTDMSADTLVLRTAGGARIVYKKEEPKSQRTGGWGKLTAIHAALVLRDEDFWPSYERMWTALPEWELEGGADQFVGAGPDLPARTARHGSPAGRRWYEIRGRGDDWYDWDTNCFHFMGGEPTTRSFSEYEPHTMEWQLPRFLEAKGEAAAS